MSYDDAVSSLKNFSESSFYYIFMREEGGGVVVFMFLCAFMLLLFSSVLWPPQEHICNRLRGLFWVEGEKLLWSVGVSYAYKELRRLSQVQQHQTTHYCILGNGDNLGGFIVAFRMMNGNYPTQGLIYFSRYAPCNKIILMHTVVNAGWCYHMFIFAAGGRTTCHRQVQQSVCSGAIAHGMGS